MSKMFEKLLSDNEFEDYISPEARNVSDIILTAFEMAKANEFRAESYDYAIEVINMVLRPRIGDEEFKALVEAIDEMYKSKLYAKINITFYPDVDTVGVAESYRDLFSGKLVEDAKDLVFNDSHLEIVEDYDD